MVVKRHFIAALVLAPVLATASVSVPALAPFLQDATRRGSYLGAVALVMQGGRVVSWQASGHRDLARREAMQRDAIFRIYSMSKTVVSLVALMLVEEGRLALDDPIERHLPEFALLRVFAGGTADQPLLRAPARPLTIRHLLTHTAGFALAAAGEPVAAELLRRAAPWQAADLTGFAARVARVPLALDPGQRFHYDGVQTEVLSRVLEAASGQPLDVLLRARVFEPLRMHDTGFEVPVAQRHRIADLSVIGPGAGLVLAPTLSARHPGERLNAYFSGAGGLYSTAADFARLCQLLHNGGTLDGVRLLEPRTVDLMLTNQLHQTHPATGLPPTQFIAGEEFGFGGRVLVPGGRFSWSGAASTYFMIDRSSRLTAILLLQHLHGGDGERSGDLPRLAPSFYRLVEQALVPTPVTARP